VCSHLTAVLGRVADRRVAVQQVDLLEREALGLGDKAVITVSAGECLPG
jgi:hypothetical protein